MNPFQEMLRRTTSSIHYDKMKRFVAPLNDHFGVNHFWYFRITKEGQYAFLGTHPAWNEYSFRVDNIRHYPCLRHPDTLRTGINFMKQNSDEAYKMVLRDAWDRFKINFNFQLLNRTADGIEAYGFGTNYNHPDIDEALLNELDLLRYFIKEFRIQNQKLFHILYDNQVDLGSHIGSDFYKKPNALAFPKERDLFLRKLKKEECPQTLTRREREILKFMANGYPASYIAIQLDLSVRTVQNYIATMKEKLYCESKVEMIQKAQDLLSIL